MILLRHNGLAPLPDTNVGEALSVEGGVELLKKGMSMLGLFFVAGGRKWEMGSIVG